MSENFVNVRQDRGMGWLPDAPDHRDYNSGHEAVSEILKTLGMTNPAEALPKSIDLRQYFPPVDTQGKINSCAGHVIAGLVDYYEFRSFGRRPSPSRLFLYKVARNLLKMEGDVGTTLRSAMAALTLIGVPDEKYWPYDETAVNNEPTQFAYSIAADYKAVKYVRLDPFNQSGEDTLKVVRSYIAGGLVAGFGLTLYSCIWQAEKTGIIPYPSPLDVSIGRHALVAVGYDDEKTIRNLNPDTQKTSIGGVLVRNSWGPGWGESGYGWLPYDYITSGVAVDWWSLLRQEWVDTQEFGL
jgi:C1A family cysteine protease